MLDPFPVTKLGLTALDQVRRRVQHDVHRHRGHRGNPLYGIRRILCRRADRLSERAWDRLRAGLVASDRCGEVTAAWTIAQDLMRCYQLRDASAAAAVITAARDCPVPEIARLGRTLHTWRAEFLAHFAHTDVSNGPTESLNLKIKNTKRTARGFRNFANYRLRCFSTTAESRTIIRHHGSGPAVPAWWRRAVYRWCRQRPSAAPPKLSNGRLSVSTWGTSVPLAPA